MKKDLNPIQNIFIDIDKILSFIYFKNDDVAKLYDTPEYARDAEMWINASNETDTYLSYIPYWNYSMFQIVRPNVRLNSVRKWIAKPYSVPSEFKGILLTEGRKAFLNQYQEKNLYYRTINGLPPYSYDEDEFIYLSKDFCIESGADPKVPIHLQPIKIQNKFMKTTEYNDLIKWSNNNYLLFIGNNKIDILTARKAKDFEIIRYPYNQYDINPNLLQKFKETYEAYRDYVMDVIYNPRLKDVYANYHNFIGLLIIFYTLMQLSNGCIEEVNSKSFLDDTTIHIIFSLYGIPEDLLVTKSIRRKLVCSILKLIQNKGTSEVFYQLIDILNYKDTKVNQLFLMKGQEFTSDGSATSNFNPYFLEVDLKEKDPYNRMLNNDLNKYNYSDIVSLDNEWIDDAEVHDIIRNRDYSISNSKFLTLTSSINQFDYLFESIFLLRFLLDAKDLTDSEYIQIPELFGSTEFSLYELALCIIAAYCKNNNISGAIDLNNEPIPVAGFNFELDVDLLKDYLKTCKYVETEKIELFIDNIQLVTIADINKIYNDVIIPMRDWLKYRISNSTNHIEFTEYENIYKAIFTYDINNTKILNDYKTPLDWVKLTYSISDSDFNQYLKFYPHFANGSVVTNENIYQSQYRTPFLALNNQITWRIHLTLDTEYGTDDRGYIYFYEILNSDNSMEITNQSNLKPFMDFKDDHWVINEQAVQKAIDIINSLDDDELNNAFFQVKTTIGDQVYKKGTKLPISIRHSGTFKNILIDKLTMDSMGMSVTPTTYLECLLNKNRQLYEFVQDSTFETNHDIWISNLTKIVLAVESNLDLYLKYFEQSIVGLDLFFKPLIILINYFKSTFVKLIKTNFTYLIDDKVDAGGNSAMINLFESIRVIRYFVILAKKGYNSQFGLFDAEKSMKYNTILKDYGFYVDKKIRAGSVRLTDEAKFFKNNEEIDPKINPSAWFIGESGLGRWSNEDDFLMKTRTSNIRVKNLYDFDFNSWKIYVESYIKN